MGLLGNERYAIILILLLWILLALVFSGDGGHMMVRKVALDWFDPTNIFWYKVFNVTYLRMVEISLFTASVWIVRWFPDNLNIMMEIKSIFLITYLINIYYEFRMEDASTNCLVLNFRNDFTINCLRSLIFSGITIYFIHDHQVVLPPTGKPNSVYELLCVPLYYEYFCKFISSKYPDRRAEFDKLVNARLSSFDSVYGEFGSEFKSEFFEYSNTWSFYTIANRLKEDANVFSMGVDKN